MSSGHSMHSRRTRSQRGYRSTSNRNQRHRIWTCRFLLPGTPAADCHRRVFVPGIAQRRILQRATGSRMPQRLSRRGGFPTGFRTATCWSRMDFMKGRVGIEVEFGHSSFLGIDLLKFQVASYSGLDKIDVGVYMLLQENFKELWKMSLDKIGKEV